MNYVDVDQLARNLQSWAADARSHPPSFEGCGDSYPIASQEATKALLQTKRTSKVPFEQAYAEHRRYQVGPLAHVLPGKGILLECDLKELGITRPIPHVYERSKFGRAFDVWNDEVAAIVNYDGIIASRGAGKDDDVECVKTSFTTVAQGWSSTFRAGGLPVAGTYTNNPGAVMINTNVGALSLGLSNPTGSDKKYLLTFGQQAAQQINMTRLVDQLVAAGAISATATSTSVGTPALTRYTNGNGVMVTCEITTALGATASNITLSYTNQAGTAGQSSGAQAMLQSGIVQRLCPVANGPRMSLASGDFGVRAIASLTLSASMTAGVFALIMYKPLLWFPGISAGVYSERDSTTTVDGFRELANASLVLGCLTTFVLTNTTSTGIIEMTMRTCAG